VYCLFFVVLSYGEPDNYTRKGSAAASEVYKRQLVDFVVDVDADKTKENINLLEKAYAQAVKAGVDKALAGTTPKDTAATQRDDTPKYGNTTVI